MGSHRRVSQLGLSLMELIVALALLGLMAAVSYPSLSLIIRSWNNIEFGVTPTDQFATERFVRIKIQQAALIYQKERSTRERLLLFESHGDGFSFVSPIDGIFSQAGLYSANFLIEETNARQNIVFSYQRYPTLEVDEPPARERMVLIEDISDAKIDYYSSKARGWVSDWSDQKRLPALIRFQFADALARTMTWVIDLKMAHKVPRLPES